MLLFLEMKRSQPLEPEWFPFLSLLWLANQVNIGREREIHNGAVGMIKILFGKVLGKSCTETKGSMERDFRPLLWHGLRTVVHEREKKRGTRFVTFFMAWFSDSRARKGKEAWDEIYDLFYGMVFGQSCTKAKGSVRRDCV